MMLKTNPGNLLTISAGLVGVYALWLAYKAVSDASVSGIVSAAVDSAATAVDMRSNDSSLLGKAQSAVSSATSHWGDTYYRDDIISPVPTVAESNRNLLDTIGGP